MTGNQGSNTNQPQGQNQTQRRQGNVPPQMPYTAPNGNRQAPGYHRPTPQQGGFPPPPAGQAIPPQQQGFIPPLPPQQRPGHAPLPPSAPPPGTPPKKKYSAMQLLILAVCAVVFAVSAFSLIGYVIHANKQSKALQEAENLYQSKQEEQAELVSEPVLQAPEGKTLSAAAGSTEEDTAEGTENPESSIHPQRLAQPTLPPIRTFDKTYGGNQGDRINDKFHDLLNVNEDIVGWIKIGDFLNQPVVKRDNEFYVTHNYKKEENPAGAIFMDQDADIRTRPENLVLHGHNMRNGSMFGKLIHYKSEAGTKFFLDNAFVQMDNLYNDGQYVIFSVFEIETDYASPNYFPFVAFQKFHSDLDARNFIDEVKSRSVIKVPLDVNENDSLLTMATCTLNSETTRLLVIGRKLRPGEKRADLQNVLYQAVKIR